MAFSMRIRKAPASEIDQRVAKAAQILGLAPLLDRYPRQLSGGQRQRVAWGGRSCAIRSVSLRRTALEPSMPIARGHAHRDQGTAPAAEDHDDLNTHDQIEAMTMADRIVVMHDGSSSRSGRPSSSTIGPTTCSSRASSAPQP